MADWWDQQGYQPTAPQGQLPQLPGMGMPGNDFGLTPEQLGGMPSPGGMRVGINDPARTLSGGPTSYGTDGMGQDVTGGAGLPQDEAGKIKALLGQAYPGRQFSDSDVQYWQGVARDKGVTPNYGDPNDYFTQRILGMGATGNDAATAGPYAGGSGGSGGGAGGPFNGVGTFNPTPFDFKFDPNNDPSYKFNLQQGLDAVQSRLSSLGTGLTGGGMKQLTQYASGLASNEYGNEFNRALQTNQTNNGMGLAANQNNFSQGLATNQNNFNQNFNLANLGLNAQNGFVNGTNNQATQASGYANNVSGLYGNIGNANAAGIVGNANARSNLYGNLISNAAQFI